MVAPQMFLQKTMISKVFSRTISGQPKFGFLFDIDGVIVRGKNVLPSVSTTFQRLIGPDKKFRIPTVFVTNSGNTTKHEKASDLSKWLGVRVNDSQVILSHSPLCNCEEYHSKRVLVSGQGEVKKIVSELGFKNIITMEELVHNFPSLDYVDKSKRCPLNGPRNKYFNKIDGIILLNEPVNWETSLQLITDLLITNGMPSDVLPSIPYPHIFVIACNMDLLWVSEAPIPRYGHGSFLLCLESLYQKITGNELIYTLLTGKPSLFTYYYASEQLMKHARRINDKFQVERIYAIGDNINTDIYGANLYNKYLMNSGTLCKTKIPNLELPMEISRKCDNITCISVLVETGVHKRNSRFFANHSPKDFLPVDKALTEPAIIASDVMCAVNEIFVKEEFE